LSLRTSSLAPVAGRSHAMIDAGTRSRLASLESELENAPTSSAECRPCRSRLSSSLGGCAASGASGDISTRSLRREHVSAGQFRRCRAAEEGSELEVGEGVRGTVERLSLSLSTRWTALHHHQALTHAQHEGRHLPRRQGHPHRGGRQADHQAWSLPRQGRLVRPSAPSSSASTTDEAPLLQLRHLRHRCVRSPPSCSPTFSS